MQQRLIECVPNFSEGRDMGIIHQITDQISATEGVKLLDIDPGKATNRTVVTFVGTPEAVIEAAFEAIKKAAELIDMRHHSGEHPRMGATDVCPLIPISGVTMDETAAFARQLAERVSNELHIPTYLYESAALTPERKNLATIRAGEYEALPQKLIDPQWKPDFGAAEYNEHVSRTGATVIGARDFLVAYNINLNTTSTRRANAVAFDVREAGRTTKDENGKPVRVPGTLKAVKAIGWYIEEYGIAQISMNLTDINVTPVHIAFDEVRKSATARGMRVTGSELVGLVPLNALLEAGRYFLRKQQRSVGVSEAELIKIAVKSLGLDELSPFDPAKKIIEYQLSNNEQRALVQMGLQNFANEVASESPAPGGGSIAAYIGALGAALGTMVANLSSHKRGWDNRWEEFSDWAARGQQIKDQLLHLVDEDTAAFNGIMAAFKLPQSTETEKQARNEAIQNATKYAIEVPFRVMMVSLVSMHLLRAMAEKGNPNSVSDVGVGALCARAAVLGAYLNVQINAASLTDTVYKIHKLNQGKDLVDEAIDMEALILQQVEAVIRTL